jgi:hypothetical protein
MKKGVKPPLPPWMNSDGETARASVQKTLQRRSPVTLPVRNSKCETLTFVSEDHPRSARGLTEPITVIIDVTLHDHLKRLFWPDLPMATLLLIK